MKTAWNVLEFGFACTALALICLFCAYAWPESKYGLAAWIQAFGSIAAIVGTWLGTRHQILSAERARQQDALIAKAEMATICLTVAGYTYGAVSNIASKLDDAYAKSHFSEIGTDRIETLLDMINTITQKNLSPRLFEYFLPLQREVAFTLTALKEYNNAGVSPSRNRVQKAHARTGAVLICRDNIRMVHKTYSAIAEANVK